MNVMIEIQNKYEFVRNLQMNKQFMMLLRNIRPLRWVFTDSSETKAAN